MAAGLATSFRFLGALLALSMFALLRLLLVFETFVFEIFVLDSSAGAAGRVVLLAGGAGFFAALSRPGGGFGADAADRAGFVGSAPGFLGMGGGSTFLAALPMLFTREPTAACAGVEAPSAAHDAINSTHKYGIIRLCCLLVVKRSVFIGLTSYLVGFSGSTLFRGAKHRSARSLLWPLNELFRLSGGCKRTYPFFVLREMPNRTHWRLLQHLRSRR